MMELIKQKSLYNTPHAMTAGGISMSIDEDMYAKANAVASRYGVTLPQPEDVAFGGVFSAKAALLLHQLPEEDRNILREILEPTPFFNTHVLPYLQALERHVA